MRNKYNTILRYIYEHPGVKYRKETVSSLFRAVLEPLASNQKVKGCILLRVLNTQDKASILKRLAFSGADMYNFGKDINGLDLKNCEKENIWNDTEFLIVLTGRYSAALMWDYTECETEGCSNVCLIYNSKIIADISKVIADNSEGNLKDIIKEYNPDRRENMLLNKSIQETASMLNDKFEEILFSELEKNSLKNDDDKIKTAEIIVNKAKFTAHEIKNQLSIINLYSKIALKRSENMNMQNETAASFINALENIKNASENITYFINDLRCMSNPVKTETELKEIIEASVSMCRKKIEEAGAEIKELKIKDAVIYTDKIKVQCALINIIFNALDAGAEHLYISADKKSIIIKNDGEEISEENRSRIFEENFTTKKAGSGLGLAFCREQLRSAGADINLVSSDKNETVFEISF